MTAKEQFCGCQYGLSLQERAEQVGKPAAEALPGSAHFEPTLLRKTHALLRVAGEHVVEFFRGAAVDDHGILLIVEAQRAGIEVGASQGAEAAVDHHDLRVVEARLVNPYRGTAAHHLMHVV